MTEPGESALEAAAPAIEPASMVEESTPEGNQLLPGGLSVQIAAESMEGKPEVKFEQLMLELDGENAVYAGERMNEAGEVLYYIYQTESGKQFILTPSLEIIDTPAGDQLPLESNFVEQPNLGLDNDSNNINLPLQSENKVELAPSEPITSESTPFEPSEQPIEVKTSQSEEKASFVNNGIDNPTNNVSENITQLLPSSKTDIAKSQLEKSTKNYSRSTSNIVWISTFSKEDEPPQEKVLTTTIELADPEEDEELLTKPVISLPPAIPPNTMSGKLVLNADPVSERQTSVTTSIAPALLEPPAAPPSEPVLNGKLSKDVTGAKDKRATRKVNKKPEVVKPNELDDLENLNNNNNKKVVISNCSDTSVKFNENLKDYSRKNLKRTVESNEKLNDKKPTLCNKLKETRTSCDFDEYHKKDLRVLIRIQPEIRSEIRKDTLRCRACGFTSDVFEIFTIHLGSCTGKSLTLTYPDFTSNFDPGSNVSSSKRQKLDDDHLNFPVTRADDNEHSEAEDDDLMNSDLSEEETCTVNGHSEKDIVWVQTKFGYWPALIMKILVTDKFSLRLINCPLKKESLTTDVKKIQSFNDAVFSKKIIKNCKEHSDLLIKAVQKAEDYSRKRCLGVSVDPVKFFNLVEYGNQSNAEEKALVPSNAESSKTQRLSHWLQVNPMKIRNYIREGRVDFHLVSVYKGDIESKRHDKFREGDAINEISTGYGPIVDDEHKDEITEHCSELFKNHFAVSDLNLGSYIFSVWAPEAIIKSISRLYHIDMNRAEEIFDKYKS